MYCAMTQAKPHDRPGWRGLHGLVIIAFFWLLSGVPSFRVWPLFMLAPLAAYAVLVAVVPSLRSTFRPWRFGRVTLPGLAATIVLAFGSAAVLLLFESRSHPDLRGFAAVLRGTLAGSVLLFGITFSIANAVIEEIIFRGILFDAAESQWGVWPAVAITTVLFGLGHLHGYPPGAFGAVLAAVFGLCLACLRVYTGGLGLPIIAHIAADATIFKIIADAGVFAS
jgi:membrane protease YdiL (CAAX protease family)